MNSVFYKSSANLRVFALILTLLCCSAAAVAQEKGASPGQPQTVTIEKSSVTRGSIDAPGTAPASSKETNKALPDNRAAAPLPDATAGSSSKDAATPASTYKSSLNSLSTLYQNEVQRVEQKNNQAKELLKDGLISHVEMEASDKALSDARAKVEEVAKQVAEANKPASTIAASSAAPTFAAGNQVWSTGNDRVDSLIRFYGNLHSVDPYLIFCLMSQESKFSKIAISPKGAQGLMQLMPGTAARYGVTNRYDIAQNISGGTRYLKDLLKMFNGRVDLALAGYNAGENAVIKYGYTIPPYDETRNYVKLIVKRYGATTTSKPQDSKPKV
jgi:soluble lytic murein transglycosylase-like protein